MLSLLFRCRQILNKMSEEAPQQQTHHKTRINLQELRNCDLVSRFLAATPPYLYASPTGPNNFFFSEMLRSLVQARTNEQTNRKQSNHLPTISPASAPAAAPPTRRNRKRVWTQQRMYDTNPNEYKDHPTDNKSATEKPLELTNKINTYTPMAKYQKSETPPKMLPPEIAANQKPIRIESQHADTKSHTNTSYPVANDSLANQSHLEPPAATAEIPPNDLVLPPPPPMWYPPLYPPYGIDPLHFFIDLRVSGHIYDRKKENISPTGNHPAAAPIDNNNTTPLLDVESIGKYRHGSAFSVPPPRRDKSPSSALNLTFTQPDKLDEFNSQQQQQQQQYYDRSPEIKETKYETATKNTHYVMQNLPKIYTNLMPQNGDERNSVISEESDSKSESDIQDIDMKDDHLVGRRMCNDEDDSNDDVVIVDGKSN